MDKHTVHTQTVIRDDRPGVIHTGWDCPPKETRYKHYAPNGDMLVNSVDGKLLRFRRVGWQINGGVNNGILLEGLEPGILAMPHGGYSPVYVEVGD